MAWVTNEVMPHGPKKQSSTTLKFKLKKIMYYLIFIFECFIYLLFISKENKIKNLKKKTAQVSFK